MSRFRVGKHIQCPGMNHFRVGKHVQCSGITNTCTYPFTDPCVGQISVQHWSLLANYGHTNFVMGTAVYFDVYAHNIELFQA